jgi:hypothetical protein
MIMPMNINMVNIAMDIMMTNVVMIMDMGRRNAVMMKIVRKIVVMMKNVMIPIAIINIKNAFVTEIHIEKSSCVT